MCIAHHLRPRVSFATTNGTQAAAEQDVTQPAPEA